MDVDKRNKIIGILIVIAMAGSMFAIGSLNSNKDSGTTDTPINTNPIVNPYDYPLSFQTTAIKELNSFRMVVKTSELNKQEIDLAIQKVDGVAKVSSQFRKTDSAQWDYFAEISLKKNILIGDVLDEIYSLSYFDGTEKVAMKYMTVSSPGELQLYNQTLDINRNFVFEATTLPALVSIETMPGDIIALKGTVTLQGKNITALELIESSNVTAQPQYYSVNEFLPIISLGNELLFEGQTDQNIDQNYYTDQLKIIDSSAQIYFVPDANTIRFAGQSTVSNSGAILNLFSAITSMSMFQDAEFELSSVFIPDLNKEIPLDLNTITAQVRLGHSVGKEVDLELNIIVQRDSAQVMQGIEN